MFVKTVKKFENFFENFAEEKLSDRCNGNQEKIDYDE